MVENTSVIISLLHSILENLGDKEGAVTEHRVQALIEEAFNTIEGGNDPEVTLGVIERQIQDLSYGLYNDDSSEGDLGDIVKLQKAVEDTPHVVAHFNSGTMGYVKWSDGRLEQWGKATTRAQDTAGTNFNLLESFKDTNYVLTATVNEQMFAFIYARPSTVKQINVRVNNGNDKSVVGASVSWKAEGYWK